MDFIIDSAAFQQLDTKTQPKVTVINRGVRDSKQGAKHLWGGTSLTIMLEKNLTPRKMEPLASKLFSKKYSMPAATLESERRTIVSKWSLANNVERSCEGTEPAKTPVQILQTPKGLDLPKRKIARIEEPSTDMTESNMYHEASLKFGLVEDSNVREFLMDCHIQSLREQKKRSLEKKLQEVHSVREQLFLDQLMKKSMKTMNSSGFSRSKKAFNKPKIIFNWHSNISGATQERFRRPKKDEQRLKTELLVAAKLTRERRSVSPRNILTSLHSMSEFTSDDERGKGKIHFLRKVSRVENPKPSKSEIHARNYSLTKLFDPKSGFKGKAINSKLEVRRLGTRKYIIRDVEQEKIRKIVKDCVQSKKSDDYFIERLCSQ
jgi:actin-related protein